MRQMKILSHSETDERHLKRQPSILDSPRDWGLASTSGVAIYNCLCLTEKVPGLEDRSRVANVNSRHQCSGDPGAHTTNFPQNPLGVIDRISSRGSMSRYNVHSPQIFLVNDLNSDMVILSGSS